MEHMGEILSVHLSVCMGSSKKSCSKGILESCGLPGAKKEFLQWNTRTKDYLCANFQDIWLSSKSWISDIKYAISTIKCRF